MPFKEVKELRKSGRLEEALAMANLDLEKEPANIWNKRSIAWVYHDYLKEYATKDDFEKFNGYLIKLIELELPSDEKMVFDTCAYQIGKLIFNTLNPLSLIHIYIKLFAKATRTGQIICYLQTGGVLKISAQRIIYQKNSKGGKLCL